MFEARLDSEVTPVATSRVFDTLDIASRAMPIAHMRDPQQPEFSPDESPLIVAGARPAMAMVEPAYLPTFERLRRPDVFAGGVEAEVVPPPPAPEEIARELISEARATARTMLAQAREVINAERTRAVEQGRAEGYELGKAEADAECVGLIQTCEQIGVHVMEERERVLAENEADTVELAIAIARRIVGAAIEVDPDLVIESCRGAMRKAFQRGHLQVLAHPSDLVRLREAGPQLASELGGVEHLDFIEERRLERGSVIVRTPAGEIDGTIAGKAAKIEQALREGIEHRRAERRAA